MNKKSQKFCHNCTPGHFILDKKQTSAIVSGLLLCSFLLFLVGYFLGKRKALEEFSSLAKQNLFNNQMHYALTKLQQINTEIQKQETTVNDNKDSITKKEIELGSTNTPLGNIMDQKEQQPNIEKLPLFQANLISFGSLTGAQQFVNRLQRNGINTTIIKHAGKVPGSKKSSKTIYWYQVVTDVATEEEIKKIVKIIKNIVKLNDVRIVKVNDGSISGKINQKQTV